MNVKKGDKVTIHYKGTLDDGTVFDSSKESEPLSFEVGSGNIIPGFEKGIIGMEEGEERNFTVPPNQAYGPHRKDLVAKLPAEQLAGFEPKVGNTLQLETKDGKVFQANVTKVEEDGVVVDLNHPLAGKALSFEVRLVGLERQ